MGDELRRLYLEPTSRCNLNCAMCFRKSWVDEQAGDMEEATFRGNVIGAIQITHRSDNEGLPTREKLSQIILAGIA